MKKEKRLLRVGVLGCGPISQAAHLETALKARNAELYAICDVAEDLVQKIAARFECRKTFTEYEAMLGDPKVEAVIVAIADQFHVDSAIRALKAGKHVLVEKPLGTTISDCERLAAEVRDSELIAQAGTMKRFDPGIRDARRAFWPMREARSWRSRRGTAIRSTARDPVHPDTLGEQLSAAIPGAALARITSKTESEVLHKVDLSRVLNHSLKPLKQELSR